MTKEYLKDYREMKRTLAVIEDELKETRARLYSIKVQSFSDLPHGKKSADWTALIAALEEQERRYFEKWTEILKRQEIIEKAIEILPPVEKAVILAYYCCLLTWAQTAELLHYDERQIYRLHDKALKKLSEIVSIKE